MEKQLLRGAILKLCQEAGAEGIGTKILEISVKRMGYAVKPEDVIETCAYLEGKGFAVLRVIENNVLNIRRELCSITAAGTDLLEGTITVEGIVI